MTAPLTVIAYNASEPALHGELPERLYSRLRDEIIRGRLAPGARAVESDIALRFSVSRTPVREALARLARERYLVTTGNGRRTEFLVTPLNPSEVTEFWGIMSALEGFAIQTVRTLPNDKREALVSELERLNSELEAASNARPRDNDIVGDLMSAFHERFMDFCAGPNLRNLYDTVRPHVQRYEWAYGTHTDATYAPSVAEHRRIISAVAAGDARSARKALEDHWSNGVQRTNALIARLTDGSRRGRGVRRAMSKHTGER